MWCKAISHPHNNISQLLRKQEMTENKIFMFLVCKKKTLHQDLKIPRFPTPVIRLPTTICPHKGKEHVNFPDEP